MELLTEVQAFLYIFLRNFALSHNWFLTVTTFVFQTLFQRLTITALRL